MYRKKLRISKLVGRYKRNRIDKSERVERQINMCDLTSPAAFIPIVALQNLDVLGCQPVERGQHRGFRFFFSSRRGHTRLVSDWSSDVCFFFFKQKTAYEIGQ